MSSNIAISADRFQWIKPRILKDPNGYWMCHDNYYIVGHGMTKEHAYENWKIKEQRRTTISRKNVWNLQATMKWFKEGCWRMLN